MANTKSQKYLITFISIFFVVYIIIRMINFEFSEYEIQEAVPSTISDCVDAEAMIFREETCICLDTNGALSYEIDDGESINVGGTIANVFADEEEAITYREIKKLEQNIQILSSVNYKNKKIGVDLTTINNATQAKIISMVDMINKNRILDLDDIKTELFSLLNQREFIIGDSENYNDKVEELEQEVAALKSSVNIKSKITSDKSGYFVSGCDGYENSIAYNDVKAITVDILDNIKQTQVPYNCVGKVISNSKWYMVAKISADDALKFINCDNDEITVSMPLISNSEIKVKVESINQPNKQQDGVIILSSETINGKIVKARNEQIQINISEYSGLKIPKNAIHEEIIEVEKDGVDSTQTVKGVYVLDAHRIDFKEIIILYSGEDYVICKLQPNSDELVTDDYLLLYDRVITEGIDIYDGKIID